MCESSFPLFPVKASAWSCGVVAHNYSPIFCNITTMGALWSICYGGKWKAYFRAISIFYLCLGIAWMSGWTRQVRVSSAAQAQHEDDSRLLHWLGVRKPASSGSGSTLPTTRWTVDTVDTCEDSYDVRTRLGGELISSSDVHSSWDDYDCEYELPKSRLWSLPMRQRTGEIGVLDCVNTEYKEYSFLITVIQYLTILLNIIMKFNMNSIWNDKNKT